MPTSNKAKIDHRRNMEKSLVATLHDKIDALASAQLKEDKTDNKSDYKIVNEYVKEELINLYNEYGMTFEISLRRNNIYIRFFTGKLFEPQKFSFRSCQE